jgi:hypothetical protein
MFGVLLLLNNCTDRSYEVATAIAARVPFLFRIIDRWLPSSRSHAGAARRMAMDSAAAWMDPDRCDNVLLTTDADSRVAANWISGNLAAIDCGVEAVTGDIALDAADEARLSQLIRWRGRLEATYGGQLTEIASLVDPEPHNPWPHHRTTSGASLAITLQAYFRVGGLPELPMGEDAALIAALGRIDARIRFSPDVRVITSGRLIGRAIGGTADTMRKRNEDPLARCDDALEDVDLAALRAGWRNRLRRLHREGRLVDLNWAKSFGLTPKQAEETANLHAFGAIWGQVEKFSPFLQPSPLVPHELPPQIERAEKWLGRLRRHSAAYGEIEPKFLASLAANDRHDIFQIRQQRHHGFVTGQRIVGGADPMNKEQFAAVQQ